MASLRTAPVIRPVLLALLAIAGNARAQTGPSGTGIPPALLPGTTNAALYRHVREFAAEDCPVGSPISSDQSGAIPPPPCRIEAILLPTVRVGGDCPDNYYVTEAYRLGDARLYAAFSTMRLAAAPAIPDPGRYGYGRTGTGAAVRMSGPYTVAFTFARRGAHRVCRPDRIDLPGATAYIVWDDEAERLGRPLRPSNMQADYDFRSYPETVGYRYRGYGSRGWRAVSCFWLGCNDRRSLHVEIRSLPSGLPILLDGVRAYLTDESFWVAARRLKDIRIKMPSRSLKSLSECRETGGANGVRLFHC